MLVQNSHTNQKDLYCFKNWINLWVYHAQPRGFLFPHSGWCRNTFNFSIQIELSFLEPIGGAGPKFAHESKGSILVKELSQAISLSCPAQGFPVPAFRLDFGLKKEFWNFLQSLLGVLSLNFPYLLIQFSWQEQRKAQYVLHAQHRHSLSQHSG